MKKVTAIIRAEKIRDIETALREANVPGYTLYPVKGHGSEYDVQGVGRIRVFTDLLPREAVEVICPEDMVDNVIRAIREASKTGEYGDGIIYITSVERIQRISTGEEGTKVFEHKRRS